MFGTTTLLCNATMSARANSVFAQLVTRASDTASEAAMTAALRALALPRGALVVHGDADVIMPFENGRALLALIPGARILRLQGGGHDLPRDVVGI